jgi:hypothetical protein
VKPRHHLWERYLARIGACVTAALVWACYGFALQRLFDDLPVMTWLRRHSWLDIWTMSIERKFSRPPTFATYKVGQLFPRGVS